MRLIVHTSSTLINWFSLLIVSLLVLDKTHYPLLASIMFDIDDDLVNILSPAEYAYAKDNILLFVLSEKPDKTSSGLGANIYFRMDLEDKLHSTIRQKILCHYLGNEKVLESKGNFHGTPTINYQAARILCESSSPRSQKRQNKFVTGLSISTTYRRRTLTRTPCS